MVGSTSYVAVDLDALWVNDQVDVDDHEAMSTAVHGKNGPGGSRGESQPPCVESPVRQIRAQALDRADFP